MKLGAALPEVSDVDWAATPAAVKALVAALAERVAVLEAEVADLRERLGLTSRNSSKPPSSDPPSAPKPPPARPSGRKRGGQKGHKIHRRERLPADRTVECVPDACAWCDHPLTGQDPDPAWHQVVDLPVILREVTEYRLHTLHCPHCDRATAGLLPDGVPRGCFGTRLQAFVALMTGRYRHSKRMVPEMLREVFQIPMSLGAVANCEQQMAAALETPYAEAATAARSQPAGNADETSWREDKQRAWLWVLATTVATVFLIHPERSREAAKKLLGDFAGVLGTDRFSAYHYVDPARRQLCWAHLDRDWQRMLDRGGVSAWIGDRLRAATDRLFRWWRWVREGRRDRAWFRRKEKVLRRAVRRALEDGVACGHAKTARTCQKVLDRFEALWTFARVAGVEPTNNFAERQLRPAVQIRKLSFGTDSAAGSRFVERILTVVMTLRQHGRNLLQYLTEALQAFQARRPMPSLLLAPEPQAASP